MVIIYATANHLYRWVLFPTNFARPTGNLLVTGTAKKSKIPKRLKNKCASDTCIELMNPLPVDANAAIRLVAVVLKARFKISAVCNWQFLTLYQRQHSLNKLFPARQYLNHIVALMLKVLLMMIEQQQSMQHQEQEITKVSTTWMDSEDLG